MATKSAHHGDNYINFEKGLWSWLTTVDHKRIGLMYMIAVMSFFFLGGVMALLLRLELFAPNAAANVGQILKNGDTYNQVLTYHGAIMVFMVIVPGIPAILGNFFLPLHIGAKDVAFPRINLASWYVFMFGAILAAATFLFNKIDTGWTFYTPYSIKSGTSVVMMVVAAFIMGMSSVLTGLNFIVTVHKLRAPGMTMHRMPLFVWALYSTAILQMLATPVLGITLLLLAVEKIFGVGIFDPALGGDPVLFQHFFWFYSHPAVYIMIIPAMGVVSELITTFSRKVIFGYTAIAYSSLGIAAVSFFVWGHHMFVSGQSETAGVVFSFLTMLVGVPTAIKMFNWVATLYKGSISFDSPMLYALGFLFLFAIGGVTGIMLATLPIDVHFHDTYFVVAHFHYVMVGGTLMALMGGFYYWFPKMFGKMFNESLARMSFVFIFIGFNVTFFPQFILGAMGMPRRYFDYIPAYASLNKISTVGSWLILTGFLIALYVIVQGIRKGPKAPANPWRSKTLEWMTTSPPPHDNFAVEPIVTAGPMSTDSKTQSGFRAAHVSHHFKDANQEYDSGKQGIWLFMVTEILMFGAILIGYGIFHNLYPEMFAEGAKSLDWKLGFVNTLVLIFSSFTMAISISFVQKNESKKAALALAATILCGAIFMVIKYFEYTHKFHLGLYPGRYLDTAKVAAEHANLGMYFGFYYAMTGLHGIHILIGMGLLTWLLIRTIRGDFHSQYWLPVEGVGIFWHIVDLIWIFLFPLLYLVG